MVAHQETIVVDNNVKNLLMIKGKRSKRSRSRPLSPSALTISTDEAGSVVSQDWTATISEEEEDMARCLILLAQGSSNQLINNNTMNNNNNNSTTKTSNKAISYECKTCNRSFPSFQALGGHRTSHKKPKIIKPTSLTFDDNFPNQLVVDDGVFLTLQMANSPPPPPPPSSDIIIISDNNNNSNSLISKVVKVHECGICGAEFSSGQALGGHMRRHRPIGTVKVERTAAVTVAEMGTTRNNLLALDLNLPAPEEEIKSSSKFVFGSNEKTLVFTASSLVDCHH